MLPINLVQQLKVFITTVIAKISGEITNTRIPMRRGFTQGGTSSPSLFKVFIDDLPKALRDRLKAKFPSTIVQYPAILVAVDVIALSATLEHMQEIADECCVWAKANGLRWNPENSQP